MVNFDLILQMIQQIDSGNIPSNITFNDFCIKFFLETKQIPLSKFLKMRGFSNKMPKIMNTRKAGELLIESKDNDDIKEISVCKEESCSSIEKETETYKFYNKDNEKWNILYYNLLKNAE